MSKVYAYVRASTDHQDSSVPSQRKAITEFCAREGFIVADWFEDDGVSGKSFAPRDYIRMRKRVFGGNPDGIAHVVVWSLSRFGRVDPDDFVVEKRDLQRAGVTLVSASEPFRGKADMADGLIGYISAHQNRDFLVRLSKDVTRGLRNLVQNGFYPASAPLGYARTVVDNNRNPVHVNGAPMILRRGKRKGNQNQVLLVPGDEDEQAAVRFMFEKRGCARAGFRSIAHALNERGSKTIKGQPWKATTVRSCLRNIVYLGHTRYGERRKYAGVRNAVEHTNLSKNPPEEVIVIENTHEPLVSADLFQRVQDTICTTGKRGGNRVPGRKHLMLFSSAITCAHCGAGYQCRPRTKKSKLYTYYQCSGRTSGRTQEKCDCWSVNVDKLKEYLFGEIQTRVSAPEFESHLRAYLIGRIGQRIRGDLADTKQLDRQIAALRQKKARILDSIADGLYERGDPALRRKIKEIENDLAVAETRKQEVCRAVGGDLDPDAIAARLVSRVANLAEMLESLDVEEQRSALFAFAPRMTADAKTREIVIETDLLGLAQDETLSRLPTGLCINHLPD